MIEFYDLEALDGKPSKLRVQAFKDFFDFLFSAGEGECGTTYFFISMPPFRSFKYFFKPQKKIILDIRDGWSIAQASGYGGNVVKKPLKAWLTRKVERFIIRRSFFTITCTPGLQKYLEDVSGRKIILIPNGISDERVQIIDKLKKEKFSNPGRNDNVIFVCAGQFSEYGAEKVKKLLSVIVERYENKPTEIRLIGTNKTHNEWVVKYYFELSKGFGKVVLLPRMSGEDLFRNMNEADYGLSIIRDPDYEFGTKIYDYIALGLPVINYFDKPNNFTDYFDACLDVGFSRNSDIPEIRRSVLIEQGLKDIEF